MDIEAHDAGMTNDSYIFKLSTGDERFIIRTPGKGSDILIDRHKEHTVYKRIAPYGFCDEIVYINPDTGYKVTKYWEGARTCDPFCTKDLSACMQRLRRFHELNLKESHSFCPFERIGYYESLWEGKPSRYEDYIKTKTKIFGLKSYIDSLPKTLCLTHIDAVAANFVFLSDGQLRLIDWEYSAMQDPHLDIAMFAIYAMFDKKQTENLMDHYFTDGCTPQTRQKIHAYTAVCGLLWSNWCEYKGHLGDDFGDYALAQYSYAKDFSFSEG